MSIIICGQALIELSPVDSVDIFQIELSEGLANLQIPRYYIESQDRWVENPDHPVYHEAKQMIVLEKQLKAFENLLKHGVVGYKWLSEAYGREQEKIWEKRKKQLRKNEFYSDEFTYLDRIIDRDDYDKYELFLKLKYLIITGDEERLKLVRELCVVESRIYELFKIFNVTRNGSSILTYPLKHNIETGIDYDQVILYGEQLVNPIEEYKIATASLIPYTEWNKLSISKRERIIALYRLNKIIEVQTESAVAEENERQSHKK